MTDERTKRTPSHRRFITRRWLLATKMIGVILAIGGLASMSAIWLFGPVPATQPEWEMLVRVGRSVFWPCVFGGIVIIVLSGVGLFLGDPRVYIQLRWFRLKVVLVVICIPGLHMWARGRVQTLYDLVEQQNIDEAHAAWDAVGQAYLTAMVVLLILAIFARRKPRMGQKRVVVRGRKSAVGDQKSEVGSQRSENGGSGSPRL